MTHGADLIGTSDDDRSNHKSSALTTHRADPSAYYYAKLTLAVSISSSRRDKHHSRAFTAA